MKKNLKYGIAAIALFCGGLAVAQIVTPVKVGSMSTTDLFQDIAKGVSQTTNVYASAIQMRSWFFAQNSQHLATAPTLTTNNCGGTTSALTGTDFAGQIIEGSTAATSCVISFATAYVTAPECFVSINNVTDATLKCAATTATLTITHSSSAANVVNYLVLGLPGG